MKSEKISAKELFNAIDQIYEEKGITKEYLIDSLKMALEAAYRKNYDTSENILVDIDEQNIKVYAVKEVVNNVENDSTEISLNEAKSITKRAKIGDTVNVEVTPKNFGRIAAVAGKTNYSSKIKRSRKRFSIYSI